MNIPKAIEIKKVMVALGRGPCGPDSIEADRLSFEALKAWKYMREHSGMSFVYYLPGETHD